MVVGYGVIGLEGEWFFKVFFVVLIIKLVFVSCFFFFI